MIRYKKLGYIELMVTDLDSAHAHAHSKPADERWHELRL